MLVEVKVNALMMDPSDNTSIVLLRGIENEIMLPIWIGAYEANAIILELEKVPLQRPMVHDLLKNTILELGYRVERVIVTDLKDNTFYAVIELVNQKNGEKVQIDSRPSDAIALALRMDSPIYVDQKVLNIFSFTISSESEESSKKNTEEWTDVIG